ncbi:MAG: acetate--CoA ligase family protein [Thermodesulfobacteriota bacterium]
MSQIENHFLEKFLFPESVAIVGASRNPWRINYHLVANLVNLGYQGKIFPVNPEAKEILGLPAYPSLKSITEPIDLAVIAVSHNLTLPILQEALAQGIKRLTVVAGGFSETGPEGRQVQKEMADLVKSNGARAIGPNALSPINTAINFAISFHPLRMMKKGGLSLIFQSGLYEPRLDWLFTDFNLHLNKLIDLGNKMDINEVEVLGYLIQDPTTKVIGIHLESIEGHGRKFWNLLKEGAKNKHLVILKSGRTEAGAKAAASHTGVIVQGNDYIFDAALRQAGAIRAQNIEEFFDLTKALERFGSLLMKGNRLAIGTLPGGEAVVVTDICHLEGFTLAPLEKETIQKLKAIFPPWDIAGNPFDLGVTLQFHDPLKVYPTLLEAFLTDKNVDAIALQLPPRVTELPRDYFQKFIQDFRGQKPVALWMAGVYPGRSESLTWLENKGLPVFPSPEKALKALSALYRSSKFKTRIY